MLHRVVRIMNFLVILTKVTHLLLRFFQWELGNPADSASPNAT